MKGSLPAAIAEAIDKAMEKAMESLAGKLCESLAQIITNQMAQIFSTAQNVNLTPENSDSSRLSKEEVSVISSQDAQSAGTSADARQYQGEDSIDDVQDSDEMEMDPRSLKRSRSPLTKKGTSPTHSKTKKYQKDSLTKSAFLKESILSKAVAESILSKS